MYNRSSIFTMANKLAAKGYSRSDAMRTAWKLAKEMRFSVKGVTQGKRQQAIDHLTRYEAAAEKITLQREAENTADRNAIRVIATVQGRGSYVVGYVPAWMAVWMAPVMDAGVKIKSSLGQIVGGEDVGAYSRYYGLRVMASL